MKKTSKFFFPRGHGGSWLNNLICHLEDNDTTLPDVDVIFDYLQKSSIPFRHGFEVIDPANSNEVKYFKKNADINVLFSSKFLFNHYLNDAHKVIYHIHKLDTKIIYEQYFTLTDSATYIQNNDIYYDYYCNNIDLDYALIFQNPNLFADNLFEILNLCELQYTPNKEYVLKSIDYYKSTCENPNNHFGNLDSLYWLGWSHALLMSNNVELSNTLNETATVQDIKKLIAPFNEQCIKWSLPHVFYWNNNET